MQKVTKLGIFIILSALTVLISCTKDSTTDTSATTSNTGTTTLKRDFTSPEDASQRVGGMASSIITSRIITARMVTARMSGTGSQTMPAAPNLSSIEQIFQDHIFHDVILSKVKSKVMRKITRFKAKEEETDPCAKFRTFLSCEEIKPKCDLGGKAEILSCNTQQNRVEAKIKAENCKESGEENFPTSATGVGTLYGECSYTAGGIKLTLGVKFENTKVTFYKDQNPIYEMEFSPSVSYVMTISIQSSTSAPRIDEESTTSAEISISLNVDGKVKGKDISKNTEQTMSFEGFKLSVGFKSSVDMSDDTTNHIEPLHEDHTGGSENFPTSITEFDFSISGRYTVSTNPSWCGDGEYVFQTQKPLKFEAGSNCPYSGEILVNNAIVQFTGNHKVKITLGNSSKEYNCDELVNSCPYNLENPISFFIR